MTVSKRIIWLIGLRVAWDWPGLFIFSVRLIEELIGRVDPSDVRDRLTALQHETAAVRRSLEETVSARAYRELAGFEGSR